jgi:hypothetical protein
MNQLSVTEELELFGGNDVLLDMESSDAPLRCFQPGHLGHYVVSTQGEGDPDPPE